MSVPATRSPVKISLSALSVHAHHGIADEERSLGQRFEFDVDVFVSDSAGGRTDDPADVVEYEAIAAVVVEVATNFRFQLMEALAEAVSLELLTEFPIERVRIAVHKIAPPLPYSIGRASVEIERNRSHLAESRVQ